ncbi:hypothetical protein CHELA1G11_21930 [Hyphomicrobiales bacterium]|nr:hypothetical protein CHELA1G2_20194 [Hyphomicrobiales bacterium]CAH1695610.1 hypothetical protein CHELA1G11_21930 [Hyphomicrobiales bacterium]
MQSVTDHPRASRGEGLGSLPRVPTIPGAALSSPALERKRFSGAATASGAMSGGTLRRMCTAFVSGMGKEGRTVRHANGGSRQ